MRSVLAVLYFISLSALVLSAADDRDESPSFIPGFKKDSPLNNDLPNPALTKPAMPPAGIPKDLDENPPVIRMIRKIRVIRKIRAIRRILPRIFPRTPRKILSSPFPRMPRRTLLRTPRRLLLRKMPLRIFPRMLH